MLLIEVIFVDVQLGDGRGLLLLFLLLVSWILSLLFLPFFLLEGLEVHADSLLL